MGEYVPAVSDIPARRLDILQPRRYNTTIAMMGRSTRGSPSQRGSGRCEGPSEFAEYIPELVRETRSPGA